MKRLRGIIALGIVLGLVSSVNAVPTFYNLPMDGSQEVPGPGDTDGIGTALFTINPATTIIEWLITVENIDFPTTGAHIHEAPVGVAGPIVYDFENALDGSGPIDAALAQAIVDNPLNYYVNVHNEPFPEGAIRGQFNAGETCPVCPPAVIPVPGAIGLVMLGLASLRLARRRSL